MLLKLPYFSTHPELLGNLLRVFVEFFPNILFFWSKIRNLMCIFTTVNTQNPSEVREISRLPTKSRFDRSNHSLRQRPLNPELGPRMFSTADPSIHQRLLALKQTVILLTPNEFSQFDLPVVSYANFTQCAIPAQMCERTDSLSANWPARVIPALIMPPRRRYRREILKCPDSWQCYFHQFPLRHRAANSLRLKQQTRFHKQSIN